METVYTIGHSVHTIDEFVGMLRAQGVEMVVDVRSVPRSSYVPHFDGLAISSSLGKEGIGYVHMPELGGLFRAGNGWKGGGLSSYRRFMKTPVFASAIEKVMRIAKDKRIAIMCAEGVPHKCHRSLIADALVARGVAVAHIISATNVFLHAQRTLMSD